MEKIAIAVTVDENYARHLAAMLVSLVEHTTSSVAVFVMYDQFSEETVFKLKQLASGLDRLTLEFIQIDDSRFAGLHLTRHFPSICYYRFLLSSELPSQLKRVIYLDPDLIVMDDISKLWITDLENAWLAAVPFESRRTAILGIDPRKGYFNSGVLVFNLDAWRRDEVEMQCFACAREMGDHLVHPDQDVLNLVCRDHWKRLPVRWNMINGFFAKRKQVLWTAEETREAMRKMGIIHFTGSRKPWHFASNHPKKKLYWKYLDMTPWSGAKPDERSIRTFLLRLVPFRWKDPLVRFYLKLTRRTLK